MSNRRRIDLDAARRAAAELTPDEAPPTVVLGEREFPLPSKLPAAVVVGLARVRNREVEAFMDVLVGLFGPDNVAEILALGLTLDEIDPIIEGAYGTDDEEESPAPKAGGKKKSAGE